MAVLCCVTKKNLMKRQVLVLVALGVGRCNDVLQISGFNLYILSIELFVDTEPMYRGGIA